MQITVNKYFDSCCTCKPNFKLFILTGARCCPAHIVNDIINTESIENLVPPKDTRFVNRTTIMELVEQLREEALQRGSKRIDFDDPS